MNQITNDKFTIKIIGAILVLLVLSVFLISNQYTSQDDNVEVKYNQHLQNKNQTSYFIKLTPDDLGNLKIEANIINYTQTHDFLLSIVQQYPEPKKDGICCPSTPKLVYLYSSDRIYSLTSNTDWMGHSGKLTFSITLPNEKTVNSGSTQQIDKGVSEQRIKLLPPKENKNLTDFSLLLFAQDENSKSNLMYYPFDSVHTVMVFEFPNYSNVNLLIEIPDELKSYSVTSSVFEQNKQTGEMSQTDLKEIYSDLFAISSTQNIDHNINYTRVEIEMFRRFYSIEKLSFIAILIFSLILIFWSIIEKQTSSILLSIAFGFYIAKRPSIGISDVESGTIIILILLALYKNKDVILKLIDNIKKL